MHTLDRFLRFWLAQIMKDRSLDVVGTVAIFVSTVLRLVWPTKDFLAGLSLALQVGGVVLLLVYVLRYFWKRSASRY